MNDREERRICGTCRYNKPAWETGKLCGFSCANEDSEAYGVPTAYDDGCGEWEDKDE